MILTVENRPHPCRVFDANGVELHFVTEAKTETGEVEQYVYHAGHPVVEGGKIKRMRNFYPKPLIVKPSDKELHD